MKTKLSIIAAMAFALHAGAQNSSTLYAEDKSVSMYHNIDGSRFSPVPVQKEKTPAKGIHTVTSTNANDYFRMENNKMYAVVNGTSTCMDTYMKLQDGSIIMPNGAVISSNGKIVHLQNGERVNILGALTCVAKDNARKEQAAGAEN